MGVETTKYRIVLDDRLTPELRKALGKANAFDNKMKAIDTTTKKTGTSLTRVFGGLAIGAGLVLATKSILTLGINMEQTRVSFETFLGSAEKGNAVIAQLNEFSNVTPFKNEEVLQSGKALLAFGADADTLIPTLRTIGDLSAGTGKDFKELALIYGKSMTQGVIQAEEINQLSEAGIPIVAEFAKMFGVSEREVKKLGSESKIVFADLETAFQNMTGEGGRFFELMQKQSKTLGGRISTLVGKFQLLGAEIGERQAGGLGNFVTGLTDFIDSQKETIFGFFDGLSSSIGSLFDSIVKLAVSWGLANNGAELFAKGIAIVGFSLGAIIESVATVIDSINSLGLAFQAIGQYASGNFAVGDALLSTASNMQTRVMEQWANNIQKLGETTGLFGGVDAPKTKEEIEKGLGLGGNTPTLGGGTTSAGTSTKSGKVSGAVAGVQSKIRNITINIEKLVEEINFNNITGGQSEAELVDAVKRALLTSVNDVNIIAR